MVLLDAHRLLDDAVVLAGDLVVEEVCPLRVGEGDLVQRLKLSAKVCHELRLRGDRQVRVCLRFKEANQFLLERRL